MERERLPDLQDHLERLQITNDQLAFAKKKQQESARVVKEFMEQNIGEEVPVYGFAGTVNVRVERGWNTVTIGSLTERSRGTWLQPYVYKVVGVAGSVELAFPGQEESKTYNVSIDSLRFATQDQIQATEELFAAEAEKERAIANT